MMKFLLVFILISFVFMLINKYLFQLIYQNMLFLLMFMFLVLYPMGNMNFYMKIYYVFGCDYYSLGLILLSYWIMSLMMLSSLNNLLKLSYMKYFNILNFLFIILLLVFMSMNLILFYLFFEASLIPVFMLILGWGFQVDRVQAGFFMLLYTLLGSLPLFYLIIYIYMIMNSLMFMMINFKSLEIYLYIMMILAFLIKMPMYMLHIWLPKAHVEAPLVGSMILAGVMLKLGSYGLMRFMMMMMDLCLKFNKFIIIISLMGGIFSSLICLYQVDMKMLVAYSSVVHMSILMSGMMTLSFSGIQGGYLMMIAHGLCSSGLFYLVNINYEQLGSRSLMINKGLINFFPSLGMLWFMFCSSNMSFPPSLNLFSEIMLINSLLSWDYMMVILLIPMLMLSAAYSIYLYSFSQHGFYSIFFFKSGVMVSEFLILILHWIPLNLLFFSMNIYI